MTSRGDTGSYLVEQLALLDTEELIAELFKRSTFVGVLIHSLQNRRYSGQVHDEFVVHSSIDDKIAIELLELAIQRLKT